MKLRSNVRLSIVVPSYNEELFIESTLQKISKYLDSKNIKDSTEVIVVAADGTDKTAQIAKKNGHHFKHFNLIQPGARVGKGRDVKAGILAARGSYVFFTDADLATPIHHIEPALKKLESEANVVIGVRDLSKIHSSLFRRMSSMISNRLIRVLVAPGISDTQCGFKGFDKDTAQRIFSKITVLGWGFDFEVIAIAKKLKLNIDTVPIDDWEDPKEDGLVGDSAIDAMIKTLKELFKVKLNLIRNQYK